MNDPQTQIQDMGMTETRYAYIGKKECGCVVAAVVDMPELKKDTAKAVKEFIASGYMVERIILGEGFKLNRCTHSKNPSLFHPPPHKEQE